MNGRVLRRTGDPAQTGSPVFGADRQKIEPAGCIVKPGKTGIFTDGPLFVIQFLFFTRPFPSSPNRAPAVQRVDSFVPAAGQSHIVGRAISPAANRLAGQPASGLPLAIPWQKIRRNFSILPAGTFPGGGRKRPPYNPGQTAGCTGNRLTRPNSRTSRSSR